VGENSNLADRWRRSLPILQTLYARNNRLNIVALISTYGYLVVALLVAIEGIGVPVPGELALVIAGAFAGEGDLSLTGVILAAWIGAIVGGSGGYWVGRTGGLSLLERYGHRIGITDEKLNSARRYFTDHGAKTIIVSRFLAILRMLASLMAGVAHMPFGLFTVCNAVGGLVWSVVFALLGYFFGSHWPLLAHYIHRVGLLTLCVAVAVIAVIVIQRRRRASESRS